MSNMTSPQHLALTQYFINENPVTFTPRRRAKVDDGQGGWTMGPPADLAPVTGRRVGINAQRAAVTRVNESGHQVFPSDVFIAMPGTDLELFDTFTIGDINYMVLWTYDSPPWRLNVEVYEYG